MNAQKMFMLAALVSLGSTAFADVLLPAGTSAETRASIQAAIDAAACASPVGTVTLGEGTFEIDAQLVISGGVTVVGQGYKKTIVKQTVEGTDQRVATITDGSTLRGVTATGGHTTFNGSYIDKMKGAGLMVVNGTVSECCVTGNVYGNPEQGKYPQGTTWASRTVGVGIWIQEGLVERTIVSDNTAYRYDKEKRKMTLDGAGIGIQNDGATAPKIDTCLICNNRIIDIGSPEGYVNFGKGGGIAFERYNSQKGPLISILNTTVVSNSAIDVAGGVYVSTAVQASFTNCIFSDNTVSDGSVTNVAFKSDKVKNWSMSITSNCLFGNDEEGFGANPLSADPKFRNPAAKDYHLAGDSPAIGYGTVYDGMLQVDLDGHTRKEKPAVGCYEYADKKGFVLILR